MFEVFLVTFFIMMAMIVIMAVGYIFQRKKIKGSCGGISDLGLEKVCDCEEPCDKRKEMLKRLEEERLAESRANEMQIDVKNIH